MNKLSLHIEVLIFVAEQAITVKEIQQCLQTQMDTKFKKEEILEAVDHLIEKYQNDDFAIEIVEISNGFRFMSKGAFYNTIATYLKQSTKKKLSKTALETLSIIAYKQPVPKSELEQIRGVNCDYSIQKLLEKELIEMVGRDDGPGRPMLYGTSPKFMDYFGLKSIADLPKTKDISTADSEIGDTTIEIESISSPSNNSNQNEEE